MITLIGANPLNLVLGDAYVEVATTATDNVDGDVTVVIVGLVDVNTLGTYTATGVASNSSSITRTVNVLDTTGPHPRFRNEG